MRIVKETATTVTVEITFSAPFIEQVAKSAESAGLSLETYILKCLETGTSMQPYMDEAKNLLEQSWKLAAPAPITQKSPSQPD